MTDNLDGASFDLYPESTEPVYRRYTTAELRAMTDTARMEDRKGRVWEVLWREDKYGDPYRSGWATKGCERSNFELSRLPLRRIA
jgi:hypothetical protein